jgi:hypothetical protein
MSPTIFDPSPRPTAPPPARATVRVRPAPRPAEPPSRRDAFWRALRATLEGVAHR